MTEYNLYCDESCHLEHDDSDVMVLGALIIPKDKKQEITENILQIKARYGVKARTEVKWTKASMPKIDLYKDLLNCFFLDDDMRFRVLVAKKTRLNHEAWSQSHNDWYYKMYFTMLNRLFDSTNTYNVYVDIKDTHSAQRTEKLEEVLANSHYDFNHECIKKVQPIRSDEVQMMQITGSSLSLGLSDSTYVVLGRVVSLASFALMLVRGMFAKWFYRKSAAEHIRRIRAEFPDAAQRKAVLCAQGGTSWAAVLGCLVLLMVIGSAFTLLLGPNVDALIHLVYG